jgi:hypothetical protein
LASQWLSTRKADLLESGPKLAINHQNPAKDRQMATSGRSKKYSKKQKKNLSPLEMLIMPKPKPSQNHGETT